MIINYSRKFKKSFTKLPSEYQEKTACLITKFIKNHRDSSLGIHPLHGKMVGSYAFSVTGSIRVIFSYLDKSVVLMLDVGGHDQVY